MTSLLRTAMAGGLIDRRLAGSGLVAASAGLLAGCDAGAPVLAAAERLNYRSQRLLGGHDALAREFLYAERSPLFRTNGNVMPASDSYRRHLAEGFVNWRLRVDGLVARPLSLSLADLARLRSRSQVTRHDCVEGWSAIGQWIGTPLALILNLAGVAPRGRYVAFHCADDFSGAPYYESVDLADAFHPQTILAWGMNGGRLPVGHGAPLRLRVERQLGYKQAKYVMRVEVRDNLSGLYGGKGGYWEDSTGYEWYAGI